MSSLENCYYVIIFGILAFRLSRFEKSSHLEIKNTLYVDHLIRYVLVHYVYMEKIDCIFIRNTL